MKTSKECEWPGWICYDYQCKKCHKVYCGGHYICGCFTNDGKPIEGVGMMKKR